MMTTTLPTSIYYSKGKLRLLLFVSIVFDMLGIFCTTDNPGSAWSFTPHLLTKFGLIGLLVLALGLYLGYAMIKKLGDNDPVIIVDADGIRLRDKIVHWQDIERVEILEVKRQSTNPGNSYTDRYVVPVLKAPQKYYSQNSPGLLGGLSEYRTDPPVQLSTNNLNCSTDELFSILETGLTNYRSMMPEEKN